MQRWTPRPLTRGLLTFIHTPIYFAALATGASFFWVVDLSALLPIVAVSLALSVWLSSRVFVEIEEGTLRIGSFQPILPRVFAAPISTISAVRIRPQQERFLPHFLEVTRDDQTREFPFGWLSQKDLQKIVDAIQTMMSKRNGQCPQ